MTDCETIAIQYQIDKKYFRISIFIISIILFQSQSVIIVCTFHLLLMNNVIEYAFVNKKIYTHCKKKDWKNGNRRNVCIKIVAVNNTKRNFIEQ